MNNPYGFTKYFYLWLWLKYLPVDETKTSGNVHSFLQDLNILKSWSSYGAVKYIK